MRLIGNFKGKFDMQCETKEVNIDMFIDRVDFRVDSIFLKNIYIYLKGRNWY